MRMELTRESKQTQPRRWMQVSSQRRTASRQLQLSSARAGLLPLHLFYILALPSFSLCLHLRFFKLESERQGWSKWRAQPAAAALARFSGCSAGWFPGSLSRSCAHLLVCSLHRLFSLFVLIRCQLSMVAALASTRRRPQWTARTQAMRPREARETHKVRIERTKEQNRGERASEEGEADER